MKLLVILSILSFIFRVEGFLFLRRFNTSSIEPRNLSYNSGNVGSLLSVTQYLDDGNSSTAQELAKVTPDIIKGITSYSGYFTVDKKCGSNLFFWFFPAQLDWEEAPLVLWLQGGPGASSLLGLFDELGPISVTEEGVDKRKFSWNVKNNLLFIDQPVGTGFSFTEKGCYARNESDVSKDLFSAVTQFYQLFPSLRDNKFYITGESYAGHYIPVLGYAIHKNNQNADNKINLSGLMIGNGFMDAKYQSDFSDYLYQLGLIDESKRDWLYNMVENLVKSINAEDWSKANEVLFTIETSIEGKISQYKFTENNVELSSQNQPWMKLIQQERVRRSLHIGEQEFHLFSNTVMSELSADEVRSVKHLVEELLEHYPIVFYHGQLDIICAYPMAVKFFRSLQWSGSQEYLSAPRQQWCVNGDLAGFFKSSGNLHEIMVRNAGHMVPQDQPLWAFHLINSVTSSPPDNPLHQLGVC